MSAKSDTTLILVKSRLIFRVSHDNHTITASSDQDFCFTAASANSRLKGMRIFKFETRLDSRLFEVHFCVVVSWVMLVGLQNVIIASDKVVFRERIAHDKISARIHLTYSGLDKSLRHWLKTVLVG